MPETLGEYEIKVSTKEAVRNLEDVTRALRGAADAHTRPGVRTTEFWLTTAMTLLAALAAAVPQVLPDDGSPTTKGILRVAAIVGAALAIMGYSVSRAVSKRAPGMVVPPRADGQAEEIPTERITPQRPPSER